ncbi:NifU family protein [Pontibacter sp. E15-1]|uniref:NifU family protein n=1 Tax=Pontibacter sp. E15-1 TaxID=2919918 RepID=UPI001F4F1160|nr:NifU family protein [Pontibacter sp. E15-1]MCJ8163977.1 NifU family protein [Pontibacter sp. E15-1]
MLENKEKVVSVYAEANPNPESMKFVMNVQLLPEGQSVDYPTLESALESPLAQELFNFDYVSRVFIASNFVTVTKGSELEWVKLIPELRTFLKSYIESGGPAFNEGFSATKQEGTAVSSDASAEDAEISKKVIDLLENYVRPAVEQDGGNITFKSYHEGVVTVFLQGSCSGCPSATVTLKAGIENLLKRMVPEVTEVVADGVTV